MPPPAAQSVESATQQINDMLEAMAGPGSQGFSAACLDQETTKLIGATRSQDGKTSTIVVEMQVKEKHCNQLMNLHGERKESLLPAKRL